MSNGEDQPGVATLDTQPKGAADNAQKGPENPQAETQPNAKDTSAAPSQPKPSSKKEAIAELTEKLVGPTLDKARKEESEVSDDDLLEDPTKGFPKEYLDTLSARTRARMEKLSGLSKKTRAEAAELKRHLEAAEQDAQVFRLLEKSVPEALNAKRSGHAMPQDVQALKPVFDALKMLFDDAQPQQPQSQAKPQQAEQRPDAEAEWQAKVAKAIEDFDMETAKSLLANRPKSIQQQEQPRQQAQPRQEQQTQPQADPMETYWENQAKSVVLRDIGSKADVGQYFAQNLMPTIAKDLEPTVQAYRAKGYQVDAVAIFNALPAQEKHRLTVEAHQKAIASKPKANNGSKANMLDGSGVRQRPSGTKPSGNPVQDAVAELSELMG
jgi:hypothetical protein